MPLAARPQTAILTLALGLGFVAMPLAALAQTEALSIVYGPAADTRDGDIDKIERVVISLPADIDGAVVLRVFDPDLGGGDDTLSGRADGATEYRVWGGAGAFTDMPRPARQSDGDRPAPFDPDAAIDAPGSLIFETVYGLDDGADGQWVSLTELDPADGEAVGDRIYFRLDVRGAAGDDGNVFGVGLSREATADVPVAGAELFSFAPTLRWPGQGDAVSVGLSVPADGTVTVQNFDAAGGDLSLQSDFEDVPVRASGQDDWAVDTLRLLDPEVRLTLFDGAERPNDVTLSAFGADGAPLPLTLPVTRTPVIDRPAIDAVAAPLSTCLGMAFDGSGSEDPLAMTYAWDFGDGAAASTMAATHTYAAPGTYETILSIRETHADQPRGNRLRLPVTVRNAPVADAGADITVAPDVPVAFSAAGSEASDTPLTGFAWDFGDGAQGSGIETTHTYTTPGIYRADLRVSDDSGHPCDSAVATRVVTVNAPPVAEAGPDQSATVGTAIALDASGSTDIDGALTEFAWDMGDGTVLDGAAVTHAYAAPGTYTVTLTVLDDAGVENSSTQDSLTVTVNAPPVPVIDPLPRPVAVGEVTTLSAAASTDPDGAILRYDWDFGDGSFGAGQTVQYAWAQAGVQTVTLTVTDTSGTATATQSVTRDVIVSAPPASEAGPDQALTASVIRFDGTGSADPDGTITSYEWTFGDGATATGAQVSHAYRAPGIYDVTLTVRDDSGAPLNIAQDRMQVTINATPLADAGPDVTVTPGQPVTLDARFSADPDGDISEAIWTLPWGETLTGETVEARFMDPGLYRIGLEVRDDFEGGQASAFDEVVVTVNAPPVAVIGPDLLVEPGQPVIFSGVNSYDPDGSIETYRWDFDDLAEPVFGATVERSFDSAGVVGVQLTVVDASGALNATDLTEITVRINHAPVAEAGDDVVTDVLFVDFDGTGSSDADGDTLIYTWDFGDGSAAVRGRTPRHVFPGPGSYPVTLTVNDGTGLPNATATDAMVVVINAPPVAVAGGNRDVCSGDAILFDATGSFDPDGGLLRYLWDFGDGTTSDLVNPNKTYEEPGTYAVTLTVRDESGSDLGVDIDRIATIVREGPIADAGEDLRACTNQNIRFDGSGSTDVDGAVNAFDWVFGDGGTGSGETPVHVYTEPGTYTVTLTITGEAQGQCSPIDTDQMTIVVDAAPELAIVTPDILAAGVESAFSVTLDGADTTGASLNWTISDGASYEGERIAHTFDSPGEYIVTVEVDLADGSTLCGVLTQDRRVIVNAPPFAAFDGPAAAATGEAVTFDAGGAVDPDGAITAYLWEFGDGATGTGLTATHVYTTPGAYDVTLSVVDDAGVSNSRTTVVQPIAVNPAPVAGLAADDAVCVGAVTNWSSGFGADVAASWDFGDGGTATGPEVTHVFTAPGLYPVTLSLDDGAGLPNSRRTEEAYARVNATPVAIAGPDRIVNPGDEVVFDATGSGDLDGGLTGFEWVFSDGVTLNGATVSRSFPTPGPVTATLTVTDDSGAIDCNTGTDSVAVLVNGAPSVDAGPDREVPVGAAHDVLVFDASAASDPDGQGVSITWDMGDGTTLSGATVVHRYAEPGSYTVTVTARDATGLPSGVTTDTATITALAR